MTGWKGRCQERVQEDIRREEGREVSMAWSRPWNDRLDIRKEPTEACLHERGEVCSNSLARLARFASLLTLRPARQRGAFDRWPIRRATLELLHYPGRALWSGLCFAVPGLRQRRVRIGVDTALCCTALPLRRPHRRDCWQDDNNRHSQQQQPSIPLSVHLSSAPASSPPTAGLSRLAPPRRSDKPPSYHITPRPRRWLAT